MVTKQFYRMTNIAAAHIIIIQDQIIITDIHLSWTISCSLHFTYSICNNKLALMALQEKVKTVKSRVIHEMVTQTNAYNNADVSL